MEDRDTATQGGFQIAALVTTIAIALAGGAITGFLLKLPIMDRLLRAELYDDATFWMVFFKLHYVLFNKTCSF